MGKKKGQKHLRVVTFDEELITKSNADKLLSESIKNCEIQARHTNKNENEEETDLIPSNSSRNGVPEIIKKKRKKSREKEQPETENNYVEQKTKRKKTKSETIKKRNSDCELNSENPRLPSDLENVNNDTDELEEKQIKRKKKLNKIESPKDSEAADEVSVENPTVKTGESIRAQKRNKYLKLLEEKRLKVEQSTQENALNYLSKWKHCRNEWKFEKLKQIWLHNNLFDSSKVPTEFWETAVEYFSGSKGSVRNVILQNAIKIIEKEENTQEENTDEDYLMILQRARDIVQNLQE